MMFGLLLMLHGIWFWVLMLWGKRKLDFFQDQNKQRQSIYLGGYGCSSQEPFYLAKGLGCYATSLQK